MWRDRERISHLIQRKMTRSMVASKTATVPAATVVDIDDGDDGDGGVAETQ